MKAASGLTHIIKIVCVILTSLCFVPAFTVSCANRDIVEVTPWQSIFGYYSVNEATQRKDLLHEAEPWCIFMVVMPLVLVIIWFFFKNAKRAYILHLVTIGGVFGDCALWAVFKKEVCVAAASSGALVNPQIGYYGTIYGLGCLLALTVIHLMLLYMPPRIGKEQIGNENNS